MRIPIVSFFSSVIPSRRLIVYFALGSLPWVVALLSREFIVAAQLYLLVLAFVALLDLVLSPQPQDFEIERHVPDKMNLGTSNKVRLEVRSRAARMPETPMPLTLRDEPPLDWPVTLLEGGEPVRAPVDSLRTLPVVARLSVGLLPRRAAYGEYSVTPTRRGVWRFGAISGRYLTRLGFWHRQFRRETEQEVRVYPDTAEVRRYELLLHQDRLRELGLHTARLRGRGTEFESLREYSSDDNYKDINWKASARRGKLISTQYEIERDQTVLIALDCGRMMTAMATERNAVKTNAGGLMPEQVRPEENMVPLSKLDCAINATVLLAHVSASMGDAVGVLLFADTVLGFVPPRKGRIQIGTIINALYAVQPALVEPDYIGAYNYLISRKLRRALVVTFTDVIDPDASRELLQASGALRKHHNALCVTVNNRDVMDLAQLMPQDTGDLYTKAMAQRMLSQRAAGLEELRRRGVGILDVEASQLTVATVNRYLDLKSRAAL
ncbi:MAG TPA: DUF58 domain-containing protein [Abditibacteriaceae bacterium]|jgi:uncharacterized protein (DUF58 family)